jgi:hypothetical protein
MKRMKLLIIILFVFTLTGCIQEYNVTDQQSDAASEYMASLLLKYDERYEQDLISKDRILADEIANEIEDANSPSPTLSPKSDTNNTEDQGAANQENYTLTEVIGEKNFEIEYTGYIVTETYPENSESAYFSLSAYEGNQLLVTSFVVKNKSKKEKTLNLSKAEILYQLNINVGAVYKPSLTLLENDLQYIDVAIAGEKSETVLLIFEVSKKVEMSNINLLITKDGKSEIIEIK